MTVKLVDNHVLWEQNNIVEMLLKTEPELYADIQNPDDEILEWWLVTPFLSRFLREESEPVLIAHECHWWGRTQSGQALHMDGVFGRICDRLN